MPAKELPGRGLYGKWDLGESQWKDQMDSNLEYLSIATQPELVVAKGPLPASATLNQLAWDESTNTLRYWDGSKWETSPVQPQTGWTAYASDLDEVVIFSGGSLKYGFITDSPRDDLTYVRRNGEWVVLDYYMNAFIPQLYGSGDLLSAFIIPSPMRMTQGSEWIAKAHVAGSSNSSMVIQKNGVNVGTISFPLGSKNGTVTIAADDLIRGDEINIISTSSTGGGPEGIKVLVKLQPKGGI